MAKICIIESKFAPCQKLKNILRYIKLNTGIEEIRKMIFKSFWEVRTGIGYEKNFTMKGLVYL